MAGTLEARPPRLAGLGIASRLIGTAVKVIGPFPSLGWLGDATTLSDGLVVVDAFLGMG